MKPALTFALAVSVLAAPAAAEIREGRIGLTQHNICVADCDNADKESGPNVSGEVVFASPGFLRRAFSPRPYLAASLNTAGDTSFVAAGLHWNWNFAPGWSFEPGFGYAIHNGEITFPFPQGDPRNDPVSERTLFFGSRDLFRTSIAITRDLPGPWGAQLMFEHLSHGQVLASGRNPGLDNIGLRLTYSFGD